MEQEEFKFVLRRPSRAMRCTKCMHILGFLQLVDMVWRQISGENGGNHEKNDEHPAFSSRLKSSEASDHDASLRSEYEAICAFSSALLVPHVTAAVQLALCKVRRFGPIFHRFPLISNGFLSISMVFAQISKDFGRFLRRSLLGNACGPCDTLLGRLFFL